MKQPTPAFADLKTIQISHGWTWAGGEFRDPNGRRYQANISQTMLNQIDHALSLNETVIVRYGPWRTLITSNFIFSIYQIETPHSVVLSYDDIAQKQAFERDNASWIEFSVLLILVCGTFTALMLLSLFTRFILWCLRQQKSWN